MPDEGQKPQKVTVVYSPLRINWRNVLLGGIIGLLIVAIGVFAFSYYTPNATPVPSVEIKKGTPSAKTATKSATQSTQKSETADWKTYTNKTIGFSIEYPSGWDYNDSTKFQTQSCEPGPDISVGLVLFGSKSLKCVGVGHSGLWDEKVGLVVSSSARFEPLKQIAGEKYTGITIDGESAVKNFRSETSEGPRCTCTRINVNHGDKGFEIEFVNKDLQGNYDSIYDTILSTFKFLD